MFECDLKCIWHLKESLLCCYGRLPSLRKPGASPFSNVSLFCADEQTAAMATLYKPLHREFEYLQPLHELEDSPYHALCLIMFKVTIL